jgi:hypothetical protein
MKNIVFITLFSGFINVANFRKSESCQYFYGIKEKIINENDSLKFFIQLLAKAPLINTPYGNKNILKKFPNKWNLPNDKNTFQNNATQIVQHNYISLDSTFYADVEKENQLIVEANYKIAQKLFSSNFIRFDNFLKLNKKIKVKVTQLQLGNAFKTYSLIVSGNRICNNCEYPIKQTENVLINIDKQNNVIDKLIVSSIVGSDLGSSSKFFFIDAYKMIHVKDFLNDELSVGFKKYIKYTAKPDGHFVKYLKK